MVIREDKQEVLTFVNMTMFIGVFCNRIAILVSLNVLLFLLISTVCPVRPLYSLCITVIDKESKEVMTTIAADTDIYGIAVRGRTIYYCADNKGLMMLNLSDRSVSDIISSNTS